MHAAKYTSLPGVRAKLNQLIFSVTNPSTVLPAVRFPNITQARTGWVHREIKFEHGSESSWDWEELGDGEKPSWSGFGGPFRKSIRSVMKTEEDEPGKFVRKSHNIMEVRRKSDGVVVESKIYDTEEEVSKEEAERRTCPGHSDPSVYQPLIQEFLQAARPTQK